MQRGGISRLFFVRLCPTPCQRLCLQTSRGSALDPLGRRPRPCRGTQLNSPSPLSASLTSPHTVGNHP